MKEIILTQNQIALVDDEDFEKVNQYKWYAHKNKHTYYAKRSVTRQIKQSMHRFILDISNSKIQIDHEDHNGLNNQKYNLKIGTHQQNTFNKQKYNGTSKYKGVSKRNKKWRATIMINKKQIHIGFFKEEIEAALAYDQAAIIHFGDFAYLNFP